MKRKFTRRNSSKRQEFKEQEIISVIGLGQETGTTTVACILAFLFKERGENVTFLEGGDGKRGKYLYHQVGMDMRFAMRNFVDYYELVRKEEPMGGRNLEEGINWILRVGEGLETLDEAKMERLLRYARSEKVVVDISHGSKWKCMLKESVAIICVIDPLPSKMIENAGLYKELRGLKLKGIPLYLVVNKNNKGVSRHQIKSYLKEKVDLWIDFQPIEKIYAGEFSCRFPWEYIEINREIMDFFTKVSP